jgi:transcriptional regulator with XRE-family HTH domain
MNNGRVIDNLELGAAIRRRRRELELSQEELAQRLNVSYQQVQRYETGKNLLNVENLQLIAQALFVPVAYFFAQVPAGEAMATITFCGSEDEAELLALYRKIRPKEARALVMDFARLAAGEAPLNEAMGKLGRGPSLPKRAVAAHAHEERTYDGSWLASPCPL